ncbi:hypothetical protein C7999DRAFT_40484 [Corynascus novoguineensis]|uniref:Uncharacterized protein n=1 Tax=Corynascus novoguineensis TaxID=1126955 RepID=A0AAN7HRD4_9PEZI|nr:hypothetical protein C7999DRAFT_40484 [Corynascus novoguineensis]
MSLSITSTVARRGRHLNINRFAALGSLGSGSVPQNHRQQTRGSKFNRLPSHLEPYIRSDVYTRHYSHGYKYCENLYRRRTWDKNSLAEDAKSTLKRVIHNWFPERRGRLAAGRCLNTDAASRKTPDNPNGVRPGQNIEDAERAPLEHLLFGDEKGQPSKRTGRSNQGKANLDYDIDPITNRKILKNKADTTYAAVGRGVDIPVKTSNAKAQKSPFVNHYGTPHRTLLDTLNLEHKEVRWHRNDSIGSATSMAASWSRRPDAPEYPDLHRYTAVRAHEPDGKYKAESAAPPEPKDLDEYGPVRAHEPDGKYKIEPEATVEPQELKKYGFVHSRQAEAQANDQPELSVNAEELEKYGAVRSQEPDGKYKFEPESSVDSEELSRYGAVRSHEPDGKYKLESQESAVDSEELARYGAVRSHEPDGKYKLETQESAESSVDPEELAKYGAVRSHEPDGKYKLESEPGPTVDPEELAKYGAVRSHEPDGKYKYAAEYTETPDEAELAAYRKPVLAHEPDGLYAANYVQEEYGAEELAKYRQPFFSHEPDGKYAASYVEPSQDVAELSKYKPFRSHEPDGKYAANYVVEQPDPSELSTYGAFRSHEPDGMYALRNAVPIPPVETQRYQAFRSHEPDGKYAAEVQAAKEAQDLANHEAFTYEDAETRPMPQQSQPKELRKYQAVRWNEPDGKHQETVTTGQTLLEYDLNGEAAKQEQTPFRKKVEELMTRAAAESDASDAENGRNQNTRVLTGNFVRDFPEEFSKSWAADTALASSSPSCLSPDQESSEDNVQPALDRYNSRDKADDSSAPSNPNPPSPNHYKILVYDPTKQCIETAETTSTVPDSAAPLTPAEILLRISNPAKFFPHFAPLQAQGFEIVSGSGDVLIFRKVRGGIPTAETGASSASSVTAMSPAVGEKERTSSTAGPVGKKGKRSLPKKVAVGAVCLAGSAYSVGVVSEYFKNGGVDGKGPKGF